MRPRIIVYDKYLGWHYAFVDGYYYTLRPGEAFLIACDFSVHFQRGDSVRGPIQCQQPI